MVSFTHLDTGTDEAEWMRQPRLATLPTVDLAGVSRLVVLAAHPDDETLGAAGLISRAAAHGLDVQVIIATNGEASHPDSPSHGPETLADVRRVEVRHAVVLLAPDARLEFLDIPDGRLSDHGGALREALDRALSTDSLLAAPWGGDGHPDHEAAGRVARAAAVAAGARLLEYPIWMWHWASPDGDDVPWASFSRLELTAEERQLKARALASHLSQVRPLSEAPGDEALLSEPMKRHFDRGFETFIEATPKTGGLSRDYFEDFYAQGPDPWGFETRWYERRKRAITIASLPRQRYRHALEVGCSTGMLTAELAKFCDAVLAVDTAEAPLTTARARLTGEHHVSFERMTMPHEWPTERFDLILFSEVGYYWDRDGLERALDKALSSLAIDGTIVACHWRHPVADYPLGGDDVHSAFRARDELALIAEHIEEDFVLGVFSHPPGTSVAQETGLLP